MEVHGNRKPKYKDRNVTQLYGGHYRSHTDRPGIARGVLQ